MEVTFSSTPIPNDGVIKVGIFGKDINFLGDTTVTEIDSGLAGLSDPFVSDGTTASTQKTTLDLFHTAVNSQNDLNQHDTFNTALNTAFTVIGIVPVALFLPYLRSLVAEQSKCLNISKKKLLKIWVSLYGIIFLF